MWKHNGASNSITKQRRMLSTLIAATAFLFLSIVAQAAPADLDSTFGSGGKVFIDPPIRLFQVLMQNDGKIISAGMGSGIRGLIVRYNPNGQLDESFGVGGKIQSTLSILNIAQSDGKIIAVGTATQASFDIERYNADGTLDNGFGVNGRVNIQIYLGEALAVAIQNDGKILVGGAVRNNESGSALLYRLNTNGSVDTAFANNGSFQINSVNGIQISDLIIQPDGKILFVIPNSVYRLNPEGTLDSSFGTNGTAFTGFRSEKLALQPDGKIIVAGRSGQFAIARINTNGTTDSTFGVNGIAQLSLGNLSSGALDLAIQKNGKIVAVGYKTDTAGDQDAVAVRLTSSGVPDAGFGNNGVTDADSVAGVSESATVVTPQQDGRIVVGRSIGGASLLRYLGDAVSSTPRFDFDGDARADISVFRPSNSVWYLLNSLSGFGAVQFGISTDQIAAADFDGDCKTDIAVFRPSNGEWTVLRSSDNSYRIVNFGATGDLPRPADFDGDGKAEIAVFRPSNGIWYWLQSSDGHFRFTQFGQNGDAPLIADFDNDGKSDLAVFRPSNGVWYWNQSSDQSFKGVLFGASGDIAVPADYDGDSKTDIAVFRPSNGVWYLNRSLLGFTGIAFGQTGDKPVAADYDGDGRADISVFRPSNGVWYFLQSTGNNFNAVQFGASSDSPIPSAFTQ